jgi:hypothetical protein
METSIPAPTIRGICEIRGQNNCRFQAGSFRPSISGDRILSFRSGGIEAWEGAG